MACCMLTRVRRGCAVTADHSPFIPRLPGAVHWSHTLRDNCEPSYVHCHEQAHFRTNPQLRVTYSTWSTWQNSSLLIIDSFIIINQLSRHRDLAGCDRHRVSGPMPYTACHAASCRHTITPHLRLPYSVRPIRPILSYFLLGFLNHPIVLLVLPFPRILQRWDVVVRPALFCT